MTHIDRYIVEQEQDKVATITTMIVLHYKQISQTELVTVTHMHDTNEEALEDLRRAAEYHLYEERGEGASYSWDWKDIFENIKLVLPWTDKIKQVYVAEDLIHLNVFKHAVEIG